MKNFLVTILAFLCLFSSAGAIVNLHFCMGKLRSWDLVPGMQHNICDNCGMEKNAQKGCCHDEQKLLQADQVQQVVNHEPILQVNADAAILHTGYYLQPLPAALPAKPVFTAGYSNPGDPPIYIRNCNFRL
jgi:hypothetical protein